MPAGFGRLSLRIAPLKIDLFPRQPGLARARGEGKSLGRPNPRGAGGSWAAQCARHCQTVVVLYVLTVDDLIASFPQREHLGSALVFWPTRPQRTTRLHRRLFELRRVLV